MVENASNSAETRRGYAAWAGHYDAEMEENNLTSYKNVIGRVLANWEDFTSTMETAPLRILDVGCGTGLLGQHFVNETASKFHDRTSFEITGIDLSAEMLEMARSKEAYDALHEVDLKQERPLAEFHDFDAILSSGCFTPGHLGPDIIPKILGKLKAGGLCVMTIREQMYSECREEVLQFVHESGCVLREDMLMSYYGGIKGNVLVIQKKEA